LLPGGIEHPLDVTIQCPHDADAAKHQRPAMLCDQQQRLGETERILHSAIVERFTLTADGEFEPLDRPKRSPR
jgi:hypothetical protein